MNKMKIKHISLTSKIHLLVFETRKDLASTFLRFQEYYESPKFMGKIFSLAEFKKWYVRNSLDGIKTGKFTYYKDWNGFNVPSYVLRPFYSGKFDPLSEKEKKILNIFKNQKDPFYVIGVHTHSKRSKYTLKHEIAHGLFYTDKDYKKKILSTLSKFNLSSIKNELRSNGGYHEKVLNDECQAYSIASDTKLKTPIPKILSRKLRIIYKKHIKLKEVRINLV